MYPSDAVQRDKVSLERFAMPYPTYSLRDGGLLRPNHQVWFVGVFSYRPVGLGRYYELVGMLCLLGKNPLIEDGRGGEPYEMAEIGWKDGKVKMQEC